MYDNVERNGHDLKKKIKAIKYLENRRLGMLEPEHICMGCDP